MSQKKRHNRTLGLMFQMNLAVEKFDSLFYPQYEFYLFSTRYVRGTVIATAFIKRVIGTPSLWSTKTVTHSYISRIKVLGSF